MENLKNRNYFTLRGFCTFFFFLLLDCGGDKFTTAIEIDNDKDGKVDQYMISLKDKPLGIFIGTDEDKDGKMEDLSWVHGTSGKEKESFVLFTEIFSKEQVKTKTWYGPGSIKLFEMSDEDGDGFLETKAYFNKEAKPKILSGHIARVEIDLDKDGKTDAWLFPYKRLELDTNSDGTPDKYSTNEKQIVEAFQQLHNKKKFDLPSLPLEKNRSFAVYPELIKEERWKAILNISF